MTDTPDTTDIPPERPAHCRSPLWDHRERIERMLGARYSYEQIARALKRCGVSLTGSEVGKWCRRRGLHSAAPSRHRPRADKKYASTAGPAAPTEPPRPAPAGAPMPKAKSLSDLIAEDEAAQRAELARFFKPKSE